MEKLPFNLVKKDENTNIGIIDIEGIIGESFWGEKTTTKEDIKADLEIIKSSQMSKLIVNINSLGGDVNHALSIYDMLSELNIPVIVKLNGFVASAATIIAMAGDQIEMSENAFFLIHKPMTLSMGNSNEMENDLDFLKKLDETLINIYSQKVDKKKCEALMEEDNGNGKWLTAEEALEYGFVDSITKREKKEKKEEMAMASAEIKRLGLPEIVGIAETPESKSILQTLKDKLFGTPEDKTIEKTTETTIVETETIVVTEDPMDPQEDPQEEQMDNVEDVIEEPILSMYEEQDLRLTNLEKQIGDLVSNYKILNERVETIVSEKNTLQAEKEELSNVLDTLTEEKVNLEQRVVDLEDEPLTAPININPEGNTSERKELSLFEKRVNAWNNITDAKNAYRKK